MHFNNLLTVPGNIPVDQLEYEVDRLLAPFYAQTDDPEYLEFEPEDLRKQYETDTIDEIDNGGFLMSPWCYELMQYFHYDPEAGIITARDPIYDEIAKQLTVIRTPVKDIYKTYEQAMLEYYGFDKGPNGQYGYWTNPYGVYDWYSIGGRWPNMFMIKPTATEYMEFIDRYSKEDRKFLTYNWKGLDYKLVCATRKGLVEWDDNKARNLEIAQMYYNELSSIFNSAIKGIDINIDKDKHPYIVFNPEIKSLCQYGSAIFDSNIHSIEDYMRVYMPYACHPSKYALSFYGLFLNNSIDGLGYICLDDVGSDGILDAIAKHIERIPDDTWLVTIDTHN